MTQCGVKFVCEPISRAAGTGSLRAAALNDKALDHPVKGQAVIKVSLALGLLAAFGKVDEIPDGFGSFFGVKLGFKISMVGFKCGDGSFNVFFVVNFFTHEFFLFRIFDV